MALSLQTLRKLVEKEMAPGLSWDTAVLMLVLRELIEVNSALKTLYEQNKKTPLNGKSVRN